LQGLCLLRKSVRVLRYEVQEALDTWKSKPERTSSQGLPQILI
jgi:hypothetical protein